MSTRKVIDIANSLDFVNDYNVTGLTGSNSRISTTAYGELLLYSTRNSQNSTIGAIVLYNGGLSINTTFNANSITSGGALTIAGGASISKNLLIGGNIGIGTNTPTCTLDIVGNANISSGITTGQLNATDIIITNMTSNSINTNGITAGNINFTGNLYQNGGLYISSQWKTGTGGNLSYTDGNVGINTTAPNYKLDVDGGARISSGITTSTLLASSGITAGNINFTGNLYQNGSLYISSQWTTNSTDLFYTTGNVGIGMTNPTYTIDVSGNLRVSGSDTMSYISINSTNDTLKIQNTNAAGYSGLQYLDNGNSIKMYTGYGNIAAGGTLAGYGYLRTTASTPLKLIAGDKTGMPVILNASDNSVSITATTDSYDYFSGALKVSGGVGIAKQLYVNNDTHINGDLYVEGAINGAAASSSTFAYLTLTASDESVNLSSGSLITLGGVSIGCATDATSVTVGGSFLTAGGAAIGKNLFVGGMINSDSIDVNDIITDNISLGICNIYTNSFIGNNNVSIPTDVVGFSFTNIDTRYFQANISVAIQTSTNNNLYEMFYLEGTQTDAGWSLFISNFCDNSGVVFSITNTGQIQYTSSDVNNFVSLIIRYSVTQMTNNGTYAYLSIPTQGSYIIDSMQITNDSDAILGEQVGGLQVMGGSTFEGRIIIKSNEDSTGITNGGSLTVLGGASISNTLKVTTINTDEVTAGNINFTGNLYKNGEIYISSQWTTDSTNLFYTTGNVGINTTSPNYTLDVNGTGRINNIIGTSISTNTLIATTITGGNLSLSGNLSVAGTLTAVNITTTNLVDTNISASTLNLTTGITTAIARITNGIITNLSTGSINSTGLTTGNLNFTGSLYQNGTLYTSSQWTTNLTNIFYTTGNVGVGTTSPSATLHVVGQAIVNNASVATPTLTTFGGTGTKIQIGDGSGSELPYAIGVETANMWFSSGSGFKWYGGNSTQSSMQLTSSNLVVTGDIIAFGSISDLRLKENIQGIDIQIALETINKLRPVTFDWRQDIFNEEHRGQSDIGFIAQEVEEVIPEAVSEFNEINSGIKYKNLRHERMIPYLIGGMQELHNLVLQQKQEIRECKEKIYILEKRLL
jgi:hypothetical protein